MPFLLDGNPTNGEISEAVNYLLSNFSANLTSDPNTGQITGSNSQIIGYLYKYMMVKYADNFDGTVGFSNTQTNKSYYGLRNSNSSTESTNPVDYIWYQATGGFGTTKTLYYKVTGGRSIEFQIATSSPGYAWVPDTGAAIDLDALTMAFTVNAIIYKWGSSTPPTRPSTATTYDWATNSYTAPSGWSTSVPTGGSPGDYLWSITIMVTQTGGIQTSPLDWTNTAYPIVAVGINGQNGQNGTSNIVAYLVQSQASPTPAFSSTTTGPNAPSGWSLATPAVAVGQVLWYIQGRYNSSTTDTINGVAPNTTAWTGPIAASVFQDIRSDNWNGGNPPTPGNPATYGTQGYYIERTSGSVYLNNVYARNYIEVGGAASDVNSGVTTVSGGKITANSIAADRLSVSQLSAITADLGSINAGSLNAISITGSSLSIGSSPAISGTTMTGSGARIYTDGRFALGNSTANVVFDGSNANINGFIQQSTSSTTSTAINIGSTPPTILTFSSTKNNANLIGFTGSVILTVPSSSISIVPNQIAYDLYFYLYTNSGTFIQQFYTSYRLPVVLTGTEYTNIFAFNLFIVKTLPADSYKLLMGNTQYPLYYNAAGSAAYATSTTTHYIQGFSSQYQATV